MNHDSILQTIIAIAHEAGAIVRDRFPRTALARIDFKSAVEPVTETDIAVERVIVTRLRAAFPDHDILAEESGFIARSSARARRQLTRSNGGDERPLSTTLPASITGGFAGGAGADSESPIWVIDPVDGTNNFAHGFPHVGVSLALVVAGQPVVGVAHDPLRGETFAATAGGGATLDGQPVCVSRVEHLADAFLATGFPRDRRTAIDNNTDRHNRFVRRSLGVRHFGAAVLDLAYVACGRLDGFWEMRLKPWDVAAGVLLVREAGGRVTGFEGAPDCLSGESVVASNGHIHDQILRVIRAPSPSPSQGEGWGEGG